MEIEKVCMICKKEVPDYEPEYCCNGQECGCYGEPLMPCICSEKCKDVLLARCGVTSTDEIVELPDDDNIPY